MHTYETTAKVEDHGQIRVVGVPFAPGTEVEVTVKLAQNAGDATVAAATDRASQLFAALDKARNIDPIGPLRREELMTAKFFVDTNVLLYAGSNAADDQSKRQVARALLSRSDIALSAQVLQEFYAVAVSKQRLQLNHDDAVAVLESLAAFPVCPITRELVMQAVQTRHRYQISYWDAAILAAAKTMGCETVYSEDLSDGQTYDGVMVADPFAAISQ